MKRRFFVRCPAIVLWFFERYIQSGKTVLHFPWIQAAAGPDSEHAFRLTK